MNLDYEILLGSGSPRRRQLLADMDIPFTAIKLKDVDETYPAELPAEEVPAYLSRLKASSYATDLKPGQMLITADTVVILDDKILGKPHDRNEAVEMIGNLAGRTHCVVSGVTLTTVDKTLTFSEKTEVEFAGMTPEEIAFYVDRYKPFDKAGAYGIQEWIGLTKVKGIRGCFYNVMGLPTARLYAELTRF